MRIKQHIPEKPMGQERNQKENQKVSSDKLKQKYIISIHGMQKNLC